MITFGVWWGDPRNLIDTLHSPTGFRARWATFIIATSLEDGDL